MTATNKTNKVSVIGLGAMGAVLIHIRIGDLTVHEIVTAVQAYLPLGGKAEIAVEVHILI